MTNIHATLVRICFHYYCKFILPIYMFGLFVIDYVEYYGEDSAEDRWQEILGYLLRGSELTAILVVPVVLFFRDKEGIALERFQRLITPTEKWGPLRPRDKLKWEKYCVNSLRISMRTTTWASVHGSC